MLARRVFAGWAAVAIVYAVLCGLFIAHRERFDYTNELIDIPALSLAAGLVAAGLAYAALIVLIPATLRLAPSACRAILLAVVAVGLALRIAMLASTPALEDDFYRYLWDGAVVAQGINPYLYAPASADDVGTPDALTALSEDAAGAEIHARINHSGLKTIYPPTAQAAFYLAYLIEPWSLSAWRLVCLAGELATLVLLLALLALTGRAALWVALYWCNPVVVKELINSAHMEAVLLPLVLAAILLALRDKPHRSALLLGLAIATKVWPIILAPILYRGLIASPWRLAGVVAVLALCIALAALPPLLGGLDETSGFVAYATHWQTNSALLPSVQGLIAWSIERFGGDVGAAGTLARGVLGTTLIGVVLALSRQPTTDVAQQVRRLAITTTALVLLSPAQFPWYLTWAALLSPLYPQPVLIAATVLMPAYYVSFYFHARDTYAVFRDGIVWAIWLPIWATLAYQMTTARRVARR